MNIIKNVNQSVQLINSANGDPTNNNLQLTNEYHFNREICEGVNSNLYKNQEKINIPTNKSSRSLYKDNISTNSRPPSVSKSLAQSKENSYFTNNKSNLSNTPSVQTYLDRRHQETQQKINQMKMEKFKRETENMQFRPRISDNSKKIIDNLIKREMNRNPTKIRENADVTENKSDKKYSQSNLLNYINYKGNNYAPVQLKIEEKQESCRVNEGVSKIKYIYHLEQSS
jgi:hypothetical protein